MQQSWIAESYSTHYQGSWSASDGNCALSGGRSSCTAADLELVPPNMNPEEEQLMQSIMPSIFECELESETSVTPCSSQKGPSAYMETRPFSTATDDCSSDSGGSDTHCLPWGTFAAAPQVTCPDLSGLPYLLSNISKYQASNGEDDQANKKQKVEWTEDLHARFVRVVNSLGPEKAVPSKILELMGPSAAGLTRQNVASHLQKFRHRKRPRLQCSASVPHSVVTGMPVWPQCPSPVMVPGVVGCQGVWTPSAAALQNLMPTIPSHQLHASTVAQQVTSAIAQVLEAPKSQLPIGLKLDPASVLSQYESASARAGQ